jgi:hypothetical protein
LLSHAQEREEFHIGIHRMYSHYIYKYVQHLITSWQKLFSILNLYSFFKSIPSDLNLLARCGLTFAESFTFCAIKCTVTEVATGIVNASNKEKQVDV